MMAQKYPDGRSIARCGAELPFVTGSAKSARAPAEGDARYRAPCLCVADGTLGFVKRRRGRITFAGERRSSELTVAERIHLRSPIYGAMSAGVRTRRELHHRPEPDVNDRIRRSIEARRGLPRSWRSG
jgi:hypothetical protein